jgi:hypothetical protein
MKPGSLLVESAIADQMSDKVAFGFRVCAGPLQVPAMVMDGNPIPGL